MNDLVPTRQKERDHVSTLGPLQIRILKAMWRQPALNTVQGIHDHLNAFTGLTGSQRLAYTTYLTVLRNLARRGFVQQHKTDKRAHLFTAMVTEDEYKRQVVEHVIAGAFDGDAKDLIEFIDIRFVTAATLPH